MIKDYEIDSKKIQKLVYYAYSWFIAINNENADNIDNILFDEIPEAWLHGPVFPSLYSKFKSYNWQEVPKIDKKIEFENKDVMSFLNDIWDELEYMTHQELPFITTITFGLYLIFILRYLYNNYC